MLRKKLVALTISLLFLLQGLLSQSSISGPTCITPGQTCSYDLFSGTSSYSYCITGGVLVAGPTCGSSTTARKTISVFWNPNLTGSGSISLTSPVGNTSLTVNVLTTALNTGTLGNATQTINYNTIPATINCTNASGGSCGTPSYSYQWYYSYDNSTFNVLSGATSANLSFSSASVQTIYYKRLVTETGSGNNGFSSVATVNVYPQINPAPTAPSTQTINFNTSPSLLSVAGVTGGNGSYSYQWQSSADASFSSFTNVGSGTLNYQPPALTSTTWYRLMVTSNGAVVYSALALVTVYPQIQPGTISPVSQMIDYNTVPANLTVSGVSGGNGTYSYQWQSSSDNVNFVTAAGSSTAATYTPSALLAATYFRVMVSSNGASVLTTPVTVTVGPQLTAGVIMPSQVTIGAGSSPGMLTSQPAAGGSCGGNYTYQWQSSPDNSTWTAITGATALTYNPGNLSGDVYYRMQASCGSVNAWSNSAHIIIGTVAADQNYIRERVISKPGILDTVTADGLASIYDVHQTTRYFDGLGRNIQTVAKMASPLQNDMVNMQVYDAFNRESFTYLPYTSPSNNGNFKTNAMGEQVAFNSAQFPADGFYYGAVSYEPSPLNRSTVVYSPGSSWVGSGRGDSSLYLINTISDSVRLWTIGYVTGSVPVTTGTYAPGMLFRDVTTDEQGRYVIEYKDTEGHIVLKKTQLWNSPAAGPSGWLNTYYVYDDLDRLRFVIPPKAVEWLMANSWSFSGTTGGQVATGLCFRYEYDSRGRMTIKQVPDAGETWMVYDARDRMVMTQDQNRRATAWIIYKYDNLNRQDSMGLLTDANTLAYHQNLAGSSSNYPAISGTGYTSYTRTFYDDYSWVAGTASGLNGTYATRYSGNADYFIQTPNVGPVYAQPLTASTITRGLVTGQAIDIVGSSMTYKVNFYDDRARVLQTISNTWPAGRDTTSFQYDFTGKVLRKLTTQNEPSNLNTSLTNTASTKMSYDAMGRPTSTWMRMSGQTSDQLIDSMTYNELGQLSVKNLGNFLDKQVYEYNIRGWLKDINKSYIQGSGHNYFGEELGYDNASASAAGTSFQGLQYNGNIAGQIWKSAGDGVNRKYDFAYDNVNRLLDARFLQNTASSGWDSTKINFGVHGLSYDANGNIMSMTQNGFKLTGSAPIDQLTYGYVANSNRLNTVVDNVNDPTSTLGDFHYSSARSGQDYRYDGNGNLTVDKNKGIVGQYYNFLNLPETFQIPGKGQIQITYTALGDKVRKIVWDSVTHHLIATFYNNGFVYSYTDSFVHRSTVVDTLQFVRHPEGRVRWALHQYSNGSSAYGWEYDFAEKDHLGNTRVLLTQQKDTAHYMATMEAAYRPTELALFYNIDSTSSAKPAGYPTDATTNPNDSVAMVDGNGHKMGPALLLKVMAGDTVTIGVNSYYKSSGTNSGGDGSSLQSILNSLAGGLSSLAGPGHGAAAVLGSGSGPVSGALNSFLPAQEADTTGKPKAYLNWMLLDNQFTYVSGGGQSGAQRVLNADAIQALAGVVNVNHSGYLYIWVSNETKGWPVYFDNLSVVHRSGPMVEENHYYPFGLGMSGISDKALKSNYVENKYRFNMGSELQNKELSDGSGLELYDALHRMYDPQLGRFGQIDPLADATPYYSTYSFAGNNPISHIDPFGLTDTVVTTKTTNLAPAYVYGHKAQAINYINWPQSTAADRRTWASNQSTYYDRINHGKDPSQPGDPASYTASVGMYKRWTQEEKNYRAMQAWAVGIIAAPALVGAAPAAVAYGLDFTITEHISAAVIDVSLQTIANGIEGKDPIANFNFASTAAALVIGAPEGASLQNVIGVNALNATIGTSINISAASLQGHADVFSFNPISILIATAFGTAGAKVSGAIGGGNLGDGLVAPINVTGQAVDSGTKPKEK